MMLMVLNGKRSNIVDLRSISILHTKSIKNIFLEQTTATVDLCGANLVEVQLQMRKFSATFSFPGICVGNCVPKAAEPTARLLFHNMDPGLNIPFSSLFPFTVCLFHYFQIRYLLC